jgi:glycosyltransferase involved in cell wall biosynthesis
VLAIVPTLGERTDTLGSALESLHQQDGPVCRLVVVAPPAATEARAIAADAGAEVVDDPRRGLSAAMNAGLAARRGEDYLAWIGDDDVMRDGGLQTLADMLDRDPAAVVAFGACEYMNADDEVFAVSRAGALATRILRWGPDLIPQPASLTRLDAMEAVGPYDESLRFVMDLDMFLRLRALGRFLSTGRTVACYRWHPDALTVAHRGLSITEAEMVKRRHLPRWARPVAPLWELPVRAAISVVSVRLSTRARRPEPVR